MSMVSKSGTVVVEFEIQRCWRDLLRAPHADGGIIHTNTLSNPLSEEYSSRRAVASGKSVDALSFALSNHGSNNRRSDRTNTKERKMMRGKVVHWTSTYAFIAPEALRVALSLPM
jgi:hypothetical protein